MILAMSDDVRIHRDGTVDLGGVPVGRVFGEPRNWCFVLADYRAPATTRDTGWHSKREAAEMCVRAHRETPPGGRRPIPTDGEWRSSPRTVRSNVEVRCAVFWFAEGHYWPSSVSYCGHRHQNPADALACARDEAQRRNTAAAGVSGANDASMHEGSDHG